MAAAREAAVAARPRAHARRLSRARAPDQRPRPRLPRQRRLVAAAGGGHRRGRGLRARAPRQRAPRRAHAVAGSDGAVRGRAREGAALRQRGLDSRKSCSCAAPPRRSTSSRSRTARPRLGAGDEIVVSRLEHHSNIVPWQLLAAQTGAVVRVVPIDRRGVVDFEAYLGLLGPRTRIVALAHVSNALGTVLPIADFIAAARERGIATVVDGAQAVPHLRGRRPGARLRLLRVLGAQDVRPDRHRRAVCARSPCSPPCRPGRAAAT